MPMCSRFCGYAPWLVGLALTCVAAPAISQVFVYPQRPSQSHVRYEQFDWHWVDIRRSAEAEEEETWEMGPRFHNKVGPETLAEPGGWALTPSAARGSAHSGLESVRARPTPRRDTEPTFERGESMGSGAIGRAAARSQPPDPPPPDIPRGGGVRLYFYERERDIAERAAAAIAEGYDYVAREFDFATPRVFPYFLYSSYHEFLQTNLFPLQEGVLGVTATVGELEMTLPYFGDHQMFDHISVHELVHQFTIQKVRTRARELEAHGDPLGRIPLWFIEGIAEYYALRGMDDETAMLMRDLALNPKPQQGYALPEFFQDQPRGFLWTYKFGQARVAFLEDVYGEGTIQTVLEQSPRLVSLPDDEQRVSGFPELLARITGDRPPVIARRFESWLKEQSFERFLGTKHRPESLDTLGDGIEAQAMSASQDGTAVLYRTINPNTRRSSLRILDPRAPDDSRRVVRDGVPNIESLHPIADQNFDIGDESLAFVARRRGRDVIYWQDYEHKAERITEEVTPRRAPGSAMTQTRLDRELRRRGLTTERERWDVGFSMGDRESFVITDPDVIAVEEVALSPDEEHLAFIGLAREGQRDIYVLERATGEVVQLVDDRYAERGISWGEQGIIYTSDATEDAYFNLFRIAEVGAKPEQITSERRDHMDPRALDDGRVMFVAYNDSGANLYEVDGGNVVRRTDVATGVFSPAPAPRGMWVLHHHEGRRRIARMPGDEMIEEPQSLVENRGAPGSVETLTLDAAKSYDPFSLDNWSVGPVFGVFGASAEGVFGEGIAVATDRLRDHTMVLQLQAFGSFDLIDGDLFYSNARDRTQWGAGLFQDVSFRIDRTFEEEDDGFLFTSAERFTGARAMARYPLDQYRYIQAGVAGGVAGRFLTNFGRTILEEPELNPIDENVRQEWEDAHSGLNMRGEASLSLGYNTLRLHPATGPIAGASALLSGTFTSEPGGIGQFARTRLDGEYYIPIRGSANVFARGGVGQIFGSGDARDFFLSSLDTLRSVPFGDPDLLLGRTFGFSTVELQVPLNPIVRVAFIDLEGIAGVDFGGVGSDHGRAWDKRILNGVTGVNFGIGWIVFRLHFARPFDIGGETLPNDGDWNVNFSLGYRYM